MEEKKVTTNIKLENARIIYRNFEGRRSDYNEEGNRNFGLLIPDDMVNDLIKEGWNIKYLPAREDDPDHHEQAWLPVKVKFGDYPPIAMLISGGYKEKLDADSIGILDRSMIANVDIVVRPYNYPALRGRPAGVSAYLKAIYVTLMDDEFAEKYARIPNVRIRDEED